MGLWCSIMLRLLAASSEFPNGAHALIALDPLRLPIRNSDVLSTSLQAQAALANPPHDHLLGIRISHAKFRANLLKTVAIHKKRKTDTHRHSVAYIQNTCSRADACSAQSTYVHRV